MTYPEGWNELEYLAENLAGRIDEIGKRALYLAEWMKEIDEEERPDTGGESSAAPEFPEVALKPLQEYRLARAREADRLEKRPDELQDFGTGTAELDDARRLLSSTGERVHFLEVALGLLEKATDWVDSFYQRSAVARPFADYRRQVEDAVGDFVYMVGGAAREGRVVAPCVKQAHQVALRREAQKRQADELAAAESARQQAEAARAAARDQEAEEARRRAAAIRTPEQLADLLDGRWAVTVVDVLGNVTNQDVVIRHPVLRRATYQAVAPAVGWRCDATWAAVNGRQIRVLGTQTGPLGVPPLLPMDDFLTFDVYDRNTLRAMTTQGLRMDWIRR